MRPNDADWRIAARSAIDKASVGPRAEHKGRVEEISDGIAMISGLRDVRLDEVVRFLAPARLFRCPLAKVYSDVSLIHLAARLMKRGI